MNYPRIITALVTRTSYTDCDRIRRCQRCYGRLAHDGHDYGCAVERRARHILHRQLRETARAMPHA